MGLYVDLLEVTKGSAPLHDLLRRTKTARETREEIVWVQARILRCDMYDVQPGMMSLVYYYVFVRTDSSLRAVLLSMLPYVHNNIRYQGLAWHSAVGD